jgi:predicted membrane-bound spermidine synthase
VVRAYKVIAIFVAAVGVGWFVYRVIADPGDSAAWIWLGFFVVAVCARGARVLSRQFRR